MLKNYLKIAFRNLVKGKVYSVINIVGLAVGLACFILIALYVQHEVSFDEYHTKSDRIYRLASEFSESDYDGLAKVTAPWGEASLEQIPEVKNMTRFISSGTVLVRSKDERFYESNGFFADSSVFQMFSFNLKQGNPDQVLAEPNTIAISENLAQKYFGNEDPLGQTLLVEENIEYTVTGVFEEVPRNSHFTFDFLISMSSYSHPRMNDWVGWSQFYTYLLLDGGTSAEAVEQKMLQILRTNIGEEAAMNVEPFLQPLTDIHLTSNLWREIEPNSNMSNIFIFSAIGIFILAVACINFINLMTARAATRSKEVGIRKVIGAQKSSLIKQFLGESIVISAISLLFAVFLIEMFLPVFSNLMNSHFTVSYFSDFQVPIILLGITVFVGVCAGIYPALVLSAPEPSSILKGVQKVQGNVLLRKGLVTFQFMISVFLILSTLVVNKQLGFIQNKELGFNKEQLINIPIRDNSMTQNYQLIKDRFLQQPGVTNVSFSGNLPGGGDWGMPYSAEGIPEEEEPGMRILAVDHNFIETYGMNIVEGRDFDQQYSTDQTGAFIINQEAARQLGWDEPLEKFVSFDIPALDMYNKPVVGVVEDFHFRSMKEEISPIILFVPPNEWLGIISVKVRSNQVSEALSQIETVWADIDPVHPFSYSFFDEDFGKLHEEEEKTATLFSYFTFLAIFIAGLGLFGLVTFSVERRTKEIGIRKVLGARVTGILGMLSKEYLKLVLLGFLVAVPLALWVMQSWLSEFAYKTEIGVWVFIMSGGITLFIATLAVGYQAIKASLKNPVKSLRSE